MLTALVAGSRSRAWPGGRAACPNCAAEVLAKCGEIKVDHWAHVSRDDCDPWFEPESAWHLAWKALFPPERVEVVRGPHRADVVLANGTVIELQHSSLSPAEVREREAFYGGRMVWIVDAGGFAQNLYIHEREGYLGFSWKWPRLWMAVITRPLIWDFGKPYQTPWKPWMGQDYALFKIAGRRFFKVHRIYTSGGCRGWGLWVEDRKMAEALGIDL